MKFICLGYYDATYWESLADDVRNALIDECFDYDDELRANGHFAGGEALDDAGNAVTIRYTEDGVSVTDGPYAETKEQIGGILILEADNFEHAVELMTRHPGVRNGPFEIRAVGDMTQMIADSEQRRRRS